MPMRHGASLAKKVRTCDAPQRLVEDHLVVGVDAVNLEHVFGKINADRDNLHVDGPLM